MNWDKLCYHRHTAVERIAKEYIFSYNHYALLEIISLRGLMCTKHTACGMLMHRARALLIVVKSHLHRCVYEIYL